MRTRYAFPLGFAIDCKLIVISAFKTHLVKKILVLLCLFSINPDLFGQVNSVQSGNATIGNNSSSLTINLPSSVIDDKSILIVTAAPKTGSTDGPEDTNVLSQLNCTGGNCSSIRIERHGNTGVIDLSWRVVEFESTSSITVYRGTIMHGTINKNATPDTETIQIGNNGATAGQSFVLLSDKVGGIVTTHDDTVEGELDGNGDLILRIGDAKPTGDPLEGEVAYQVVDYGNSIVKQGNFTLEDNVASTTISVSGGIPNPDKTWLIYNYWNNTNTVQEVSKLLIQGSISGNDIVFDREVTTNTNYDVYGSYYLVEFTDNTTVQHASMSFTSTSKTGTATLDKKINPDCAIPVVGYQQRGGKAASDLTNFAPGWFLAEFDALGESITLSRGETDNVAAQAYWFAIQFDYCAILAEDDFGSGYIGQDVSVNILDNDRLGGGITISSPTLVTVDLDPNISGVQNTFFVSGEGTWTYSNATGEATFSPLVSFTGDPTPIPYTINEISTDLEDEAIITITYTAPPTLSIVKTADTYFVLQEGTIEYTIVVQNTSAVDAVNVKVTDILPSGINYISNSAEKTIGATTTPANAPPILVSEDDNITIGANEILTVTFDATVSTSVSGLVTNLANAIAEGMSTAVEDDADNYIPLPPVANDDVDTTPNEPQSQGSINDLSSNDTDVDNDIVLSSIDLDPSSVSGGVGTDTDLDGDIDRVISSQGQWDVDNAGNLTFDPANGFKVDPEVLAYSISDNHELVSNQANLFIDYLPKASDDYILAASSGDVYISIIDNDIDGDVVVYASIDFDPASVGGIGTDTDFDGDIDQVSLASQGVWTVDANGMVTFAPHIFFTGNPTPLDYTIQDDELNISNVATITIERVVLAIERLTFSVYEEDWDIALYWRTSSELNNDFFEILYSEDGTTFHTIGNVDSKGDSSEGHEYKFVHKRPNAPKNYYKLKIVDIYGEVSYSRVLQIAKSTSQRINVKPNPTNGIVTLSATFPTEGSQLEIFDTMGRVIGTYTLDQSNQLDLSSEKNGTYLLKIKSPNGQTTIIKKIIKI